MGAELKKQADIVQTKNNDFRNIKPTFQKVTMLIPKQPYLGL